MGGPKGPQVKPAPLRSWSLRTLATTVFLLGIITSTSGVRRCQRPHRFSVDGVEPMTVAQGHVTLVALLTSTCSFCIQQAQGLETLNQQLQANGTAVHMMIVDAGPRPAPGQVGTFQQLVSYNVYHDDENQQVWRQVFRGTKDDILIFDRCGMLTYRLSFPYSYLGYNYVTRGLLRTFNNPSLCPGCHHDRMVGDAPAAETIRTHRNHHHGHSSNQEDSNGSRRILNRSRCPQNDTLCQEIRRERRRYNRFLRQHNIGKNTQIGEEEILRRYRLEQSPGAA